MAKGQRRDPKLEGFWREVLARFAGSKLSVRGFCVLEGRKRPAKHIFNLSGVFVTMSA